MKKVIGFVIAFCMLFIMPCASASDISVIVNDTDLVFDVPPAVENGRVLVPLRAIFEALDADVIWDTSTQTVYAQRDDVDIRLGADSNIMYVNGSPKTLDAPPKATNGRILVPVRAISEAFGCDVAWNQAQKIVHISEFSSVFGLSATQYDGSPYTVVNKNMPYFNISNYTSAAFEMYMPLDSLGRCTYAMAMLGRETLPADDRESIGSIEPSGWHSVTYDCVPGKYLYNRCHLIGYQLSAENANECNLITGTRYLNTEAMLPFENMIADYIAETNGHVLYRVTPFFDGDNLVAKGVLLEAMSYEDGGEGICFNVFCHNVQPGVVIDYANGLSTPKDQSVSSENKSLYVTYVLNTNTKKFHVPSCSSVTRMSAKNREDTALERAEVLSRGYSPCGICNP